MSAHPAVPETVEGCEGLSPLDYNLVHLLFDAGPAAGQGASWTGPAAVPAGQKGIMMMPRDQIWDKPRRASPHCSHAGGIGGVTYTGARLPVGSTWSSQSGGLIEPCGHGATCRQADVGKGAEDEGSPVTAASVHLQGGGAGAQEASGVGPQRSTSEDYDLVDLLCAHFERQRDEPVGAATSSSCAMLAVATSAQPIQVYTRSDVESLSMSLEDSRHTGKWPPPDASDTARE
jgi:hypothetical protein